MYEKHGETIKAQTFLGALQSDAGSVTFTNCTIEGVVDLFSIELERDANDRILLNKRLSCIGCTFKNIVNFRTVVFHQEVDFRRTLFESDLDFDEAILHGPCAFREAIFQRRADFHSAIFHKSASFWRARFHNVADFHRVQFCENAIFHEANFLSEVNFRRVAFQGILDCTGTWFSEMTAFNSATFLGTTNFTGAQFVSAAAFRDVQYIPDTLFHAVATKLGREQQRPTQFYLDSRHIDEVASPFFRRYVADQQFYTCVQSGKSDIGKVMAMEFGLRSEPDVVGVLVSFLCVSVRAGIHADPDVDAILDAGLDTPFSSNDGCLRR